MDLLIPSTGLLFWMTITFLVVFFLLWKFGFPVITGMVKERQAFIDESLKKAHEANERLANIQKEGESILQEAREKQAQMLKEAAATRDAIVEQAQTKARSEGARLLEEAKATIEQESPEYIAKVKAEKARKQEVDAILKYLRRKDKTATKKRVETSEKKFERLVQLIGKDHAEVYRPLLTVIQEEYKTAVDAAAKPQPTEK